MEAIAPGSPVIIHLNNEWKFAHVQYVTFDCDGVVSYIVILDGIECEAVLALAKDVSEDIDTIKWRINE